LLLVISQWHISQLQKVISITTEQNYLYLLQLLTLLELRYLSLRYKKHIKFRPYFAEKSLVPYLLYARQFKVVGIVDKVLTRLLNSISVFSKTTLSIKDLYARLSINHTQHKTLIWIHSLSGVIILSIIKLSVTFYNCCGECHYVKCHCAFWTSVRKANNKASNYHAKFPSH